MKTLSILIISLLCLVQSQAQDAATFDGTNFNTIVNAANTHFDPIKDERGVGYKPFKRWEYEAMFEAYPDGNLDKPKPNILDEFNQFKSQFQLSPDAHSGDWTSFGSGDGYSTANITRPLGGYGGGAGRINCIAGHPTNSNIMLAGSPAGGLWKTTNGGDLWFPVSDGIPSVGVSEIVFHPTNPQIIYLNTGDGEVRTTRGVGILKSTDGGDSWQMAGDIAGSDFWYGYDLEIHPTNPSILFATSWSGLYVTYDAGDSWTQLRDIRYYDVEFKEGNPDIVYCSWSSGVRAYEFNGSTYSLLQSVTVDSDGSRTEIATCPSAPNRLYAIVGSTDGGFEGLYWSVNDGADWSQLSTTPNILLQSPTPPDSAAPSQAWYDLSLVVKDDNDFTLLAGGINIWKTESAGILGGWDLSAIWTYAPELAIPGVDYVHADIHDLVDINGDIYACCDGGIFKSTDFGENWTDISAGLVISQPYRIDSHPSTSNTVIGGCQDTGMNQYDSDDEMEHLLGGDGTGAVYVDSNPLEVYVSKQNGNLHYSNDGGTTYTNISNPAGPFYTHYVLNPADAGDKFFGGRLGLWRELDGGGFGDNAITAIIDTIVYVAQAESDPQVVYAAEMENIIRSENALSPIPDWQFVTNNLPTDQAPLRGIAIDPNDEDHVWVTFRGWVDGVKVFETFDGGDSWINKSANLPNFPVHCVAVDPNDSNGAYLGTEIGVFYHNSYTDDWIWFSNGLPVVPVYDINLMPSENKLRIATFGRGVWESPEYDVCEINLVLSPADDPSIDGFSGQQYYEAASTLSSTRTIEGGLGVNVFYQSGDVIILEGGFEVKNDCLFEAVNSPCNGSAPPLVVDPTIENEDQ